MSRGSVSTIFLLASLCAGSFLTFRSVKVHHDFQAKAALRSSQQKLHQHLSSVGYEPKCRLEGRGIVIPAGTAKHKLNAYIIIKVLRAHLNCSLPIEVFIDGDSADEALVAKLEEFTGVDIRNTDLLPRPTHLGPWPERLHGYAQKVFGLYHSKFKQVLLLDCDSQPLINPETLFDLPTFQQHGAVFWPDYWTANSAREAPQPKVYELLGLPEPWADQPDWACVESGQILFDKARHMDALEWVMWLNVWSEITYKYVYGDKDTFEISFMLSGKHDQFYRNPTPPRGALSETTTDPENSPLLHVAMVQLVDGHPTFLHRTADGKFDLALEPPKPTLFTEPLSLPAAKQLVWGGGMYSMPAKGIVTSPPCSNLSRLTQQALRYSAKADKIRDELRLASTRYTKCAAHHEGETAIPVPALPVGLYGESLSRAIEYSGTVYYELKRALEKA